MQWLDIAAGNLDRSGNDDEVVLALADQNNDMTLWVLNGSGAGDISNAPNYVTDWYWDDQGGRGNVEYNCVATGDLNGDGLDEIALGYNVVYAGAEDRYWQQHLVTYRWVPVTAWDW